VALLYGALLRDLRVPLRVYRAGQCIPLLPSVARPVNAALVVEGQLVPHRPARTHPVIPRHVMEPEQKFFRAGAQVGEAVADGRTVLTDGVAARRRAVEAEAARVGPMIVDRVPVGARLLVPPRRGAIVVPAPHEVMKAERRHVVNQRVVRLDRKSTRLNSSHSQISYA